MKRKVLFLCTGNAARSQMAEAIVNSRLGEVWEAFSAGTRPAESARPAALAALAEIGIRYAGRPKMAAGSAERISTRSPRYAITRRGTARSGGGRAMRAPRMSRSCRGGRGRGYRCVLPGCARRHPAPDRRFAVCGLE
ncbi:MAG: hypothetical protein JW929_11245 [Anaerolineales bacterium]|nr:hypothetical protein [Anaerolineales bacterium]